MEIEFNSVDDVKLLIENAYDHSSMVLFDDEPIEKAVLFTLRQLGFEFEADRYEKVYRNAGTE